MSRKTKLEFIIESTREERAARRCSESPYKDLYNSDGCTHVRRVSRLRKGSLTRRSSLVVWFTAVSPAMGASRRPVKKAGRGKWRGHSFAGHLLKLAPNPPSTPGKSQTTEQNLPAGVRKLCLTDNAPGVRGKVLEGLQQDQAREFGGGPRD